MGHARLEVDVLTTEPTVALVRIQISNLPADATEPQVRAMFLPHGQPQFYSRALNEHTHRPGSIAYVEMAPAEAAAAIKALKGTRLGSEVLAVTAAVPLAAWAPAAVRTPQSSGHGRTVTAPSTSRDAERAAQA